MLVNWTGDIGFVAFSRGLPMYSSCLAVEIYIWI